MRCLVTGAAGFIGSHLAERLVTEGHEVTGVDCFIDNYERGVKEANLAALQRGPRFRFAEVDLLEADLPALLAGVEWLFHQAGQPGVRASWGRDFAVYARHNMLATQALLEAAKSLRELRRFVFASSSSIYGDPPTLPTSEDTLPQPVSPYGVTKLAAEHLGYLYWKSYGVPVVALRYFTVYGPRQRPDMAFHRFIEAVLDDRALVVHEDGEQTRDFTFVSDVVAANLLAARAGEDVLGKAINIAGGARVTIRQVLAELERVSGRAARISYTPKQRGDVRHTYADVTRATTMLGYHPTVRLADGLLAQWRWQQSLRAAGPS